MNWPLHLVWLGAAACGRPAERVSDVPRSDGPRDAVSGAQVSTDAAAPDVDLGAGFEALPFAVGRYAVLVERSMAGAHARQHVTHRSFASVVLELGDDGKATACVGWRHAQRVDEPLQDRRFSLQQGFAGTHALRDRHVVITLAADDAVCPEVRVDQAPVRMAGMSLRCVRARPRGHASLTEPVLLCEWREADSFTLYDFTADGLAPDRWLLLGHGHGVRARVSGKAISTDGAPVKVVAETAAEPIAFDAWNRALPPPENMYDP